MCGARKVGWFTVRRRTVASVKARDSEIGRYAEHSAARVAARASRRTGRSPVPLPVLSDAHRLAHLSVRRVEHSPLRARFRGSSSGGRGHTIVSDAALMVTHTHLVVRMTTPESFHGTALQALLDERSIRAHVNATLAALPSVAAPIRAIASNEVPFGSDRAAASDSSASQAG